MLLGCVDERTRHLAARTFFGEARRDGAQLPGFAADDAVRGVPGSGFRV